MRWYAAVLLLIVSLLSGAALLGPSLVAPVSAGSEPGGAATPLPSEAPVQTTPPPPLPVRELNLPQVVETRLENGLEVIVVPQQELPLLSVRLVVPGGQSAEPEGMTGVSHFTAELLTRGTTLHSAQRIAARIEQVGGSLDASASQDDLSVSAWVLSEHTDLAFELLGEVVLNPTFPEEELESYRQRALTSLKSELANPSAVAGRAYHAILYGRHPYGDLTTEQTLNAVTRAAIVNYHQAQLRPDGAFLVIVGDIEPDEAVRQAAQTFSQWPSGRSGEVSYPNPPRRTEQTIYLVDRPGSTQAEVIVGHLGIEGEDPERYALLVGNQVLGGGASARLFRSLREEKGYTYGIYSYFTFPRDVGTFTIGAAVRNEVIEPALQEILAQLQQLREAPIPPEELAAAKAYLVGGYAVRMESAAALSGQIASFKIRGLPLGLLEAYPELIERQNAEAVLAVTRRYVRPDDAAIVVVGDAARIRDGLARIAPVVMVDAEGSIRP